MFWVDGLFYGHSQGLESRWIGCDRFPLPCLIIKDHPRWVSPWDVYKGFTRGPIDKDFSHGFKGQPSLMKSELTKRASGSQVHLLLGL